MRTFREGHVAAPAIGIFGDLTDQTMPLVDFGRAVEARGFESLFVNEHTHLPVDMSTSRFPPGGEVPERYAHFWDPYVALAFVAASTSLMIGTGVSLVGEHDPIQLAHAIATLDNLSGGRMILGVGWGWNREEFANHGRDPRVRARVVEEWVALMRTLWIDDVASYHGEFASLAPSRMWPKPAQRPHPPVLLGAPASARTFARVAKWADGWITMGEELAAEDVDALRIAWSSAGREGGPRITVIYNPLPSASPLQDVVARAEELGVDRVLYHVFDGDRDRMLRRLDRAVAALPSLSRNGKS
jgi:probable F420-dependent oxidoreductase